MYYILIESTKHIIKWFKCIWFVCFQVLKLWNCENYKFTMYTILYNVCETII